VTDTEVCALGHTTPGRHRNGCPCATDHDDNHPNHCKGCLPKPASIGILCQHHFDRTRDDLLAIPGYVAYIAAAPDGKVARRAIHAYVSDRSATKVTQASPSEAWDTAELVIQWAFAWAEIVADLRHHRGPFKYLRSGVPARDVQATIDYLSAHIEYVASVEHIAADVAREAHTHRRSLERYAGQDLVVHRLEDRCPLTTKEAAASIGRPASTIRRWAAEGRLTAHARLGHRPLYLEVDVLRVDAVLSRPKG
jgi:excisionase family DNA binding protein